MKDKYKNSWKRSELRNLIKNILKFGDDWESIAKNTGERNIIKYQKYAKRFFIKNSFKLHRIYDNSNMTIENFFEFKKNLLVLHFLNQSLKFKEFSQDNLNLLIVNFYKNLKSLSIQSSYFDEEYINQNFLQQKESNYPGIQGSFTRKDLAEESANNTNNTIYNQNKNVLEAYNNDKSVNRDMSNNAFSNLIVNNTNNSMEGFNKFLQRGNSKLFDNEAQDEFKINFNSVSKDTEYANLKANNNASAEIFASSVNKNFSNLFSSSKKNHNNIDKNFHNLEDSQLQNFSNNNNNNNILQKPGSLAMNLSLSQNRSNINYNKNIHSNSFLNLQKKNSEESGDFNQNINKKNISHKMNSYFSNFGNLNINKNNSNSNNNLACEFQQNDSTGNNTIALNNNNILYTNPKAIDNSNFKNNFIYANEDNAYMNCNENSFVPNNFNFRNNINTNSNENSNYKVNTNAVNKSRYNNFNILFGNKSYETITHQESHSNNNIYNSDINNYNEGENNDSDKMGFNSIFNNNDDKNGENATFNNNYNNKNNFYLTSNIEQFESRENTKSKAIENSNSEIMNLQHANSTSLNTYGMRQSRREKDYNMISLRILQRFNSSSSFHMHNSFSENNKFFAIVKNHNKKKCRHINIKAENSRYTSNRNKKSNRTYHHTKRRKVLGSHKKLPEADKINLQKICDTNLNNENNLKNMRNNSISNLYNNNNNNNNYENDFILQSQEINAKIAVTQKKYTGNELLPLNILPKNPNISSQSENYNDVNFNSRSFVNAFKNNINQPNTSLSTRKGSDAIFILNKNKENRKASGFVSTNNNNNNNSYYNPSANADSKGIQSFGFNISKVPNIAENKNINKTNNFISINNNNNNKIAPDIIQESFDENKISEDQQNKNFYSNFHNDYNNNINNINNNNMPVLANKKRQREKSVNSGENCINLEKVYKKNSKDKEETIKAANVPLGLANYNAVNINNDKNNSNRDYKSVKKQMLKKLINKNSEDKQRFNISSSSFSSSSSSTSSSESSSFSSFDSLSKKEAKPEIYNIINNKDANLNYNNSRVNSIVNNTSNNNKIRKNSFNQGKNFYLEDLKNNINNNNFNNNKMTSGNSNFMANANLSSSNINMNANNFKYNSTIEDYKNKFNQFNISKAESEINPNSQISKVFAKASFNNNNADETLSSYHSEIEEETQEGKNILVDYNQATNNNSSNNNNNKYEVSYDSRRNSSVNVNAQQISYGNLKTFEELNCLNQKSKNIEKTSISNINNSNTGTNSTLDLLNYNRKYKIGENANAENFKMNISNANATNAKNNINNNNINNNLLYGSYQNFGDSNLLFEKFSVLSDKSFAINKNFSNSEISLNKQPSKACKEESNLFYNDVIKKNNLNQRKSSIGIKNDNNNNSNNFNNENFEYLLKGSSGKNHKNSLNLPNYQNANEDARKVINLNQNQNNNVPNKDSSNNPCEESFSISKILNEKSFGNFNAISPNDHLLSNNTSSNISNNNNNNNYLINLKLNKSDTQTLSNLNNCAAGVIGNNIASVGSINNSNIIQNQTQSEKITNIESNKLVLESSNFNSNRKSSFFSIEKISKLDKQKIQNNNSSNNNNLPYISCLAEIADNSNKLNNNNNNNNSNTEIEEDCEDENFNDSYDYGFLKKSNYNKSTIKALISLKKLSRKKTSFDNTNNPDNANAAKITNSSLDIQMKKMSFNNEIEHNNNSAKNALVRVNSTNSLKINNNYMEEAIQLRATNKNYNNNSSNILSLSHKTSDYNLLRKESLLPNEANTNNIVNTRKDSFIITKEARRKDTILTSDGDAIAKHVNANNNQIISAYDAPILDNKSINNVNENQLNIKKNSESEALLKNKYSSENVLKNIKVLIFLYFLCKKIYLLQSK